VPALTGARSGLRVPVQREDGARARRRAQAARRRGRAVRRQAQGHLPPPGAAVARVLDARA
jgi:hypothetical protein